MRVPETTTRRDGAGPSAARMPVRTLAPGAATPARALLAQQGTAGNAAVVQMLRRTGHSWAQHQHQPPHRHQPQAQPRRGAGTPSVQRMLRYDPVKMNAGYDADLSDQSGSERGRSRPPGPRAARPASPPRQASPPAPSPARTAHAAAWHIALRICGPQPGATAQEVAAVTEFVHSAAAWAAHEASTVEVAPRSREAAEFEHTFRSTYARVFEEQFATKGWETETVTESAREAARDARAAVGLERRISGGRGVPGVPDLPMNELIAPLRTFLRKSVADGEADAYKVTVKADRGQPWTSPGFYREFEVGHVWIQVETGSGRRTSFGFYPEAGAGPVQSVPGMIRCPEPHVRYTDKISERVPLEDVVRGYLVAHRRSREPYNFLRYNCTSFAAEVWHAVTGQGLPRGMVVSNPASAGSGIYDAHQRAGRRRAGGAAAGPFPYSDSEANRD
ncbi:hypothetical protein SUDANB145_04163 [Streptomyces sp. enrichment culture]|uniref:hypothetical protein n=1 Tax=Streptomyces sp. enrichment culture TaxID=1795815 RepID=UPI003F5696CF